MSLPDNILSLEPVISEFVVPERTHLLEDFSLNPVTNKLVRAYYDLYDNSVKYVEDGVTKIAFTLPYITCISFTLDLNERPLCVYVIGKSTWMYWFDSNANPGLGGSMVHTEYGSNYLTPQVAIDETRIQNSNNTDIIFAYVREVVGYGKQLCIRYQRHRFTIETVLGPCDYLYQISRMKNYRFGFKTYVKVKPIDVQPPPLVGG